MIAVTTTDGHHCQVIPFPKVRCANCGRRFLRRDRGSLGPAYCSSLCGAAAQPSYVARALRPGGGGGVA